jgi:hypothetical protein
VNRFFQYFQLTQHDFVCFASRTVSLADVVPDAHFVDHIDGFRPFLSRAIGIQSICQSGVGPQKLCLRKQSSQMTFLEGRRPIITDEAAHDLNR